MGLAGNEAAVLLALFKMGAGTAAEIAEAAGIVRTNAYRVIESLEHRGLIHRVPSVGVAKWASVGPTEIVERLEGDYRRRAKDLSAKLSQWESPQHPGTLPDVRVIHDPVQAGATFEKLVSGAQRELLMFTRPPYSTTPRPTPEMLDLLARGAEVRVIYEADDVVELQASGALDAYHDAGVQGRVLKRLPLKLAVFDRAVALLTVANPLVPNAGFPTALHVDDPGLAELLADGFETRWAQAASCHPGTSQELSAG